MSSVLELHATGVAALEQLPRKQSSALKNEGWSGFVRSAKEAGALVVTTHNRDEAVVLSIAEYKRLLAAAGSEEERRRKLLEELNARFDARMSALNEPGAEQRVVNFMTKHARLGGRVKAGQTW